MLPPARLTRTRCFPAQRSRYLAYPQTSRTLNQSVIASRRYASLFLFNIIFESGKSYGTNFKSIFFSCLINCPVFCCKSSWFRRMQGYASPARKKIFTSLLPTALAIFNSGIYRPQGFMYIFFFKTVLGKYSVLHLFIQHTMARPALASGKSRW